MLVLSSFFAFYTNFDSGLNSVLIFSSSSEVKSKYLCVTAKEECPINNLKAPMFTPFFNNVVAYVCLNLWGDNFGMFSVFAIRFTIIEIELYEM